MNTDKHGFYRLEVGSWRLDVTLDFERNVFPHSTGIGFVLIRVNPCSSVVSILLSVVEVVTKLDKNLAWVIPVKTAKRLTVVQLHAATGDI
jgi:hypothetical protein